MNSVVTPSRRIVVEQVGRLGHRRRRGAEAEREQHGRAEPERERERRRAAEHVAPAAGRGSRFANVSHVASRSRWKCMQPFGTPVVPDVNAMIATSSAAVSTGSNEPRAGRSSSTRTSSGPISPARAPRDDRVRHLRLLDHLRDLAGAQQRHRGHDDPAGEQDPEPRRDRLGRVRRVQQHTRPRLDLQRGRDRLGARRAARRSSSPPAIAVPSWASSSTAALTRSGPSSSSRSGHCSRGGKRSRAKVSISPAPPRRSSEPAAPGS